MDITPAIPDGKKLIESYGQGRFRVSGTLYEHGIIVVDDRVLPLVATDPSQLTIQNLQPLFDSGTQASTLLLLLGTGATQKFPTKELKAACRAKGIVLEAMTSDAACRTYNVLLAEGRPVAAALLPI